MTSTANPDQLEAYPGRLAEMDTALDGVVTNLDEKLQAFKDGAGEFAPDFDADAPGQWVRDLAAESRHLGGWTAAVGRAFREADRQGISDADLDNFISQRVGEPTLLAAAAAADGQADAADLREALEAAGVDPENFDPQDLINIDWNNDSTRPLYELLARIGDRASWDENYSVGFFDQMNQDGIYAIVGTIDMMAARDVGSGIATRAPDWFGGATPLIQDFAAGFALASGSVDMHEELAGLLEPESDWQLRHLSLLVSGPPASYDGQFLADAADTILVTHENLSRGQAPLDYPSYYPDDYPAFGGTDFLYDDHALSFPSLIALRALGGNTEAAHRFSLMGDDNLEVLLHPPALPMGANHEEWEELSEAGETFAGQAIERAFLEAPYETTFDPITYERVPVDWYDHEATLNAYDRLISLTGEGEVPDMIKRSVARTLLPYLNDIGEVASNEAASPGIEEDGRFARPDLVAFFKELGYDEEAARIVGVQIGTWGQAEVQTALRDNPNITAGELQSTLDPVALVLGTAYNGLNETENAMAEANRSMAFGLSQAVGALTSVGPAVVPLLAGGPVGAGASALIAGGTTVISIGTAIFTDDMANAPVDLEVDGNDIQRQTVDLLRAAGVEVLVDQGAIPGNLTPGEWSGTLTDHFGSTDPFWVADQTSFQEAFNRDADEHW